MRSVMVALLGLTVAASGGGAAEKPTAKQPGAKAAPACAALVFRPLPGGGTDGEQTAGSYKSRFARLELRATVQNGAAVNYYLVAGGNRITSAGRCRSQPAIAPAARRCRGLDRRKTPASASGSPPYSRMPARSGWR